MGSPVAGTDFEAKTHVCTAMLKILEEPGVVVCACHISTVEDEGGGSSGGWRSVQLQRVLGHPGLQSEILPLNSSLPPPKLI